MSSQRTTAQRDLLIGQLALVREMLGRLETKLRENNPDRISREDDRELRSALQHIGDEQLTRLTVGYAVCVKGLTAPLVSGAWKRELAEEVEEARVRVLARLDTLDRLARSSLGRLLLRLRSGIRRRFLRPRQVQRPPTPEEDGNLHRPA